MAEYHVEELPEESAQQVMMLIIREIDDMFNMKDLKYDVKMKVGTDGLKEIKISQINMLMQQSASLLQFQVVPPKVLGMLLADMAEAMDRPDIAKEILGFTPQPDPMQQEMAQTELEKGKAEAAKDMALAENAQARTIESKAKAAQMAASIEPDILNKMADTRKKVADADANTISKQADAYSKVKGANEPSQTSAR
jgi:hypothetical protein